MRRPNYTHLLILSSPIHATTFNVKPYRVPLKNEEEIKSSPKGLADEGRKWVSVSPRGSLLLSAQDHPNNTVVGLKDRPIHPTSLFHIFPSLMTNRSIDRRVLIHVLVEAVANSRGSPMRRFRCFPTPTGLKCCFTLPIERSSN